MKYKITIILFTLFGNYNTAVGQDSSRYVTFLDEKELVFDSSVIYKVEDNGADKFGRTVFISDYFKVSKKQQRLETFNSYDTLRQVYLFHLDLKRSSPNYLFYSRDNYNNYGPTSVAVFISDGYAIFKKRYAINVASGNLKRISKISCCTNHNPEHCFSDLKEMADASKNKKCVF